MPAVVSESKNGNSLYRKFKEINVSSNDLDKNRVITTLLDDGWVLLDVKVQRNYKCHDDILTPEANYSYLLGKPTVS